ncbi:asparagine synthase (glutamine-hydrolyzing) [Chitinimonas sp. BJB300]|uniref:asparagine synthase (glutamine-hydrolyzing) n=1 Tax=Chitinimonas sp. BJB300 TaxID=1559339 RepID=UPI000C122686|nr:asparagine synthase (glutamine-hydrolyzing) [Chitinimonas sp. BJB300]PHV12115.1 asparagine synthase (glutamine-hydrolyzing) [Chitinimonas sp. BJB300]TSJ89057.1 asparagine synthase (glutamine-hydrolyzing) [Chitinimonas sp. BJB300]
MCGIHGLYRFDGQRVTPDLLSAMGNITRHRGPDDEGMHIDGACGFAMRRLSIIDLAGGHQPLSNQDETLWLVCNGEIYNYRELRNELLAKGHVFKTGSDSEVMLHLYAEEGDAFVQRLNGMFDFALWDARRRRLLIGRDRIGVKPLYVMQDSQRLAFATEAKALLALPGVTAELDRSVLASYLQLGYVAAPGCIFKGMRKLPPATLLAIEDGQIREWRYWQLPDRIDTTLTEAEWVSSVRTQLEKSVSMQMVSDVPIGAFLSGGVDSSAVVGMMAKHADQPIRTYAIGFEGGEAEALYNELPYARQVSELFGTQHREIMVKPDVVGLLPKLIWHMDEPIADTAFITTFLVSEFARQDVKVILSGAGGDEIAAGYRRYLGGHYAERFQALPVWVRRSASYAAKHLPADRHSGLLNTLRLAKSFLASTEFGPDERYRSYLQVLGREAVAAMLLHDTAGPDPLQAAFDRVGKCDELHRMCAVDLETQLPDDILLLTDKMSMAVSLECRVPLLDHELVELMAAIPSAIKIRDGRLKHILKLSVSDMLPAEILDRKKRGFGTPMGAWLKRELAPLLQRLLSPEVIRTRGLFRSDAIQQLMADHASNRVDGTEALIALLNLEVWSRIYLDRREPADVADELKSYLA